MIWVDLLVTGVTENAPDMVESGQDADLLRLENDHAIDLAEVIANVAASLEDWLPDTDKVLLAVAARDGSTARNLAARGLLVVRPDGGLGFTIGHGKVIESVGESLAIIQNPEPGRYARGYRLPGYQYWSA